MKVYLNKGIIKWRFEKENGFMSVQSLKQIKNEYIYLQKKKVFFLFTPAEHFHKIMISNVVYMLAIYYVQSYKQNNGDRRDNH